MENQVSAIVCPNCGANTTNRKNCEYCGSMLVRFVDKNIAIDQDVLGKDALSFSSVAVNLKKNLELQNELSSTDVVLTEIRSDGKAMYRINGAGNLNLGAPDIWIYGGNLTSETKYPVFPGVAGYRLAEANIPSSSEPRLLLCLTCPPFNSEEEKFRKSCYSALFSSVDLPAYRFDNGKIVKEKDSFYYLDMGQDYESAAKIVTDFYKKIYGQSEDVLEVKTEKLSLEQQRDYYGIMPSKPGAGVGCSVALLPMLGIGAGIAAGIVKLISHLLV